MKELVNLIDESVKDLQKEFYKILEDFLNSVDGYNQLSEDGKAICKIICCLSILYKLEKFKEINK